MKKLLVERFQQLAGIKPLYEQEDSSKIKTISLIQGESVDVNIELGKSGPLDGTIISWSNERHTLEFKPDSVIDDHGTEGKDMTFIAISDDEQWVFMVDAKIDTASDIVNYVDWSSLEIDKRDVEIGEQNTLAAAGSGTSFTPGKGMGYMTPKAFKKKRKDD